jgi:glycosyltransferase involved in cell wall biosynthesis
MKKTKICIITCYKQPDYIRAKTLRAALQALPDVELTIIKNKHTGILRYPEVMVKTLLARVHHSPDIYILTFRGYEMFVPIRILTIGKKLVFDEFINLVEWAVYEHKKIKENGIVHRLLWRIYRSWLQTARIILTDTSSHADLSAKLMKVPRDKYEALIVGSDEETFRQQSSLKSKSRTGTFKVFYYGNMLPLHGIDIVIRSALLLKDLDIEITIVGGNKNTARAVERAVAAGARIIYKDWVDFELLPGYMQQADICLAGPFGNTFQSQYVITGKAYQYLQMKRPTVIGRNKESHIFTDKKDALLVKQGSPKELTRVLEWAYHHRGELPAIGRSGYALYERRLSQKILTQQVEALLARL